MGYEGWTDGIHDILPQFADPSPGIPLVVTEAGISTDTGARRAENVVRVLEAIARARDEGVDIRGYYHWSLTDNFEWAEGFLPHFGLFRVDYTTYARTGEMVQPGQPLYKIADLQAVEVRAYVTEPQLSSVKIGQQAQVTMDAGRGRDVVTGTVSWVSSEAEFTPTPIQTRDERADLVYALKIRVANQNGALKIGMPVDVRFVPQGAPGAAGS